MRDFETDFDFDFEVGVNCQRIGGFRFKAGDTYPTLVMGGAQVFTEEREKRVQALCKRIQSELRMQKRTRSKKICQR